MRTIKTVGIQPKMIKNYQNCIDMTRNMKDWQIYLEMTKKLSIARNKKWTEL